MRHSPAWAGRGGPREPRRKVEDQERGRRERWAIESRRYFPEVSGSKFFVGDLSWLICVFLPNTRLRLGSLISTRTQGSISAPRTGAATGRDGHSLVSVAGMAGGPSETAGGDPSVPGAAPIGGRVPTTERSVEVRPLLDERLTRALLVYTNFRHLNPKPQGLYLPCVKYNTPDTLLLNCPVNFVICSNLTNSRLTTQNHVKPPSPPRTPGGAPRHPSPRRHPAPPAGPET